MRIILVLALAAMCGGCATVIRGTTDQIGFNSTPSGAEVHTSNGLSCVTPCTLTVKKNEEFVATFEKPGFQPQQVPVARVVVGAGVASTAGNVIAGGVIGLGVDAMTGAGYDHVPNPVNAVMAPEVPPPAHPSSKGKPSKKPATATPGAPPASQAPAS
jgi:hypothetical protein